MGADALIRRIENHFNRALAHLTAMRDWHAAFDGQEPSDWPESMTDEQHRYTAESQALAHEYALLMREWAEAAVPPQEAQRLQALSGQVKALADEVGALGARAAERLREQMAANEAEQATLRRGRAAAGKYRADGGPDRLDTNA